MQTEFFQKIHALCRHCPDLIVHGIATCLQQQPDAAQPGEVIRALPITSSEARRYVEAALSVKGTLSWSEVGLCLASAAAVYHQMRASPAVELLWTGPDTTMPTRRMEQAVLDLVRTASWRILLVTFAAYKIDALISALNDALARQCKVILVLESRDESEAQLSHSAHNAFAGLDSGARVYCWPLEKRPRNASGRPAKLHTKCAVGDETLIVGSANLTDDAMSRNMELGVCLNGGNSADMVWGYYTALISAGELQRI